MTTPRFQEWRDQTGMIQYPFTDIATLTANTGFKITNQLFVDATIHLLGATEGLHLSQIVVTPQLVTIQIADNRAQLTAEVEFDPLVAVDPLFLHDIFGRAAGVLVSEPGALAEFATWGVGTHVFGQTAAPFVASCVIPTPVSGVQGIVLDDGSILTADAVIIGGDGCVVRKDPDYEGTIRIDFPGDPMNLRRVCETPGLFRTPRFLKTISGLPADEFGNFHIGVGSHLADGTVMRIRPTNDGLMIEAVGSTILNEG